MIKKVSTEKNFRTMLCIKKKWEREYIHYNLIENAVKWYTVDSKTVSGAGSGIYRTRIKFTLSLHTSVEVDEVGKKMSSL